LHTLEDVATALNCKLVYALVPLEGGLLALVEKQAQKIAKQRLNQISHSMMLEKQSVETSLQQEQLKELINELLSGSLKYLWKEK
jgi:predicted DNA-binding mobile mystery protein A